ncbi:MAG: hypothetical protein C4522_17865 [Desulfobacteraceae bacterium]|nr:MAG: hypothetical protein C4522_17865 [Desulfobacteraceae bacterium]
MKSSVYFVIFLIYAIYCPGFVHGEEAIDQLQKETKIAEAKIKKEEAEAKALELKKQNAIAKSELDNFGFGLGLGLMILNKPDITSAIVENDIIRVTGEEKNKMGFWLTVSWIHDSWPTQQVGLGPFLGVQLGGNNDLVNSIAAGVDCSLKRISPKLPVDFQLGYGVTRIKILADGYESNSAPPSGSTQVLLKDTTKGGWVFICSYKF